MPAAVEAVALTKEYRLYRRPIDRVIELFVPGKRHAAFAALRDVSLRVEQGETVGIVGQNGAGKSTLLKLLSGQATPTSGSLHTSGTIASIIELGTGFHPDFSGRDNAALNAAILGMSASEIKERMPDILEFSELGAFLDQPVKTYSSGMVMRLAFSVAVSFDPDILIIDEALAVGDGHFQKKCVDRIREFQNAGRTILFCSHALYYVTTLCTRAIWIDQGRVRSAGPSVDVVREYEEFLMEQDRRIARQEAREAPAADDKPARITGLTVLAGDGSSRGEFRRDEPVRVQITIASSSKKLPLRLALGIDRAADETQCFLFGTAELERGPMTFEGERTLEVRVPSLSLARGSYGVVASLLDDRTGALHDRSELRPGIIVSGDRYEIGLFSARHSFEVHRADATPRDVRRGQR